MTTIYIQLHIADVSFNKLQQFYKKLLAFTNNYFLITNLIIINHETSTKRGKTIKKARRQAGIAQRELASRSGKAQSAIARIESGKSNPTTATLNHLLDAAGFEVRVELAIKPVENSHMLDDVSRILKLTPEQRLQEVANMDRFIKEAKRV